MSLYRTLFLGIFLVPAIVAAQNNEGQGTVAQLTVDEIVQLHKAGIPEGVLITRIRQANKVVTLSTDEILRLAQAKVPERVIQALMNPSVSTNAVPAPSSGSVAAPAIVIGPEGIPVITPVVPGASRASGATTNERTAAGDPNDPMSPHDSGIYLYFTSKLKQPEMTMLEPAAYTGSASSDLKDFFGRIPGVKNTDRAVIQGDKANIRTIDRRPVFYFYFEERSAALGRPLFLGGLTSPNQFQCIKLNVKESTRETIIAQEGLFRRRRGTDSKAMVPFKSERIKPGLYKVMFNKELKPGEYAFLAGFGMGGAEQSGAAAPLQIFDFSIPVEY